MWIVRFVKFHSLLLLTDLNATFPKDIYILRFLLLYQFFSLYKTKINPLSNKFLVFRVESLIKVKQTHHTRTL